MWFDVITTLCYPRYPFEYISLHISRPHYFLSTPLSMSPTSTTSSGQPKKKLNLQSSHSTKMSSFHIGPSTEGSFSKSSSHIIPRFKNYFIYFFKNYFKNYLRHSNNPHDPHTAEIRQYTIHRMDRAKT